MSGDVECDICAQIDDEKARHVAASIALGEGAHATTQPRTPAGSTEETAS